MRNSRHVKFGTDGIRAAIGENCVDPQGMQAIGWAFATVLRQHTDSPRVCIATDTRASSAPLESALISGLTAAGVDVHRLGIVPTAVVPFWIKEQQLDGGLMLTASHNLATDNGVKLFNADGRKIESYQRDGLIVAMRQPCEIDAKTRFGQVYESHQLAVHAYTAYVTQCIASYKTNLDMKIVIDPGFGAASKVAAPIFQKLGFDVSIIHAEYDGYNINRASGSTHPEILRQEVIRQKADCGCAFDGDADRVILVDSRGREIDGDHMLFILALTHQETRHVVITPMSNRGLVDALEKHDIKSIMAKVGDQNIEKAMRLEDASFGAEPNGHLIINGLNQSGDGILAAAKVLASVKQSGKSLEKWMESFVKHPQVIVNLPYTSGQEQARLKVHIDEVLKSKGNIISTVRQSGTEPVIRVLLQGHPGQEQMVTTLQKNLSVSPAT
jgi:phosphoglucosamine mutase